MISGNRWSYQRACGHLAGCCARGKQELPISRQIPAQKLCFLCIKVTKKSDWKGRKEEEDMHCMQFDKYDSRCTQEQLELRAHVLIYSGHVLFTSADGSGGVSSSPKFSKMVIKFRSLDFQFISGYPLYILMHSHTTKCITETWQLKTAKCGTTMWFHIQLQPPQGENLGIIDIN